MQKRTKNRQITAMVLTIALVLMNVLSIMPPIGAVAVEEEHLIVAERTEELSYGEKYVLIGGTGGTSSGSTAIIYEAITPQIHKGSKVGNVLTGDTVSELDLSNKANLISVKEDYFWTVLKGEGETAALHNETSGKYISFAEEKRDVYLKDEPTWFEIAVIDHNVSGKALAFHINDYYLNYSESQGGFCAYDASQYDQDETKDTNQYAFYKVSDKELPKPEPDPKPDPEIENALATLLFCSDFQTGSEMAPYKDVSDVPESLTSIIEKISHKIYKAGLKKIDNVLVAGDYSAFNGQYNYDADPKIGIQVLKNTIQKQWKDAQEFLFVQGNHDKPSYSFSEGANEYKDYIVYCINATYNSSQMGGFPWMQGNNSKSEAMVKMAAEKLEQYLNNCRKNKDMRPIIILTHLPLHFSGRTSSLYGNGDNLYASYLFDVINAAAEYLNMVYVYGHNHSKGWDNYVGGTRVFKQPGETILVPDLSKKSGNVTDHYVKEDLNFTYMNAGYIGYIHDSVAATELTATVCQIFPDKIVFRRYSKDGILDMGAVGKHNQRYNDSKLIPAEELTKATESPAAVVRNDGVTPGISVKAAKGEVGTNISVKANVKNVKDASFEWKVEDASIAQVITQGKEARLFCKKAGSTNIKVRAYNKAGVEISGMAALTVSYEGTQATVEILDKEGNPVTTLNNGDTVELRAKLSGIPEIISYKWEIGERDIVKLGKSDGPITSLGLKKDGTANLALTVTYRNLQGEIATITSRNVIEVKKAFRYERSEKLESGKKYLLIGNSGKALKGESTVSDGITCGVAETLTADLNNIEDVVKGNYEEFLWTIEEREQGAYTLYNQAIGKYLVLSVSSRSIELSDTPADMSVETGTLSGKEGMCVAFHNDRMYLNYSSSKKGFCGYAGETIKNVNNQFALYECTGEIISEIKDEEEKPDPGDEGEKEEVKKPDDGNGNQTSNTGEGNGNQTPKTGDAQNAPQAVAAMFALLGICICLQKRKGLEN